MAAQAVPGQHQLRACLDRLQTELGPIERQVHIPRRRRQQFRNARLVCVVGPALRQGGRIHQTIQRNLLVDRRDQSAVVVVQRDKLIARNAARREDDVGVGLMTIRVGTRCWNEIQKIAFTPSDRKNQLGREIVLEKGCRESVSVVLHMIYNAIP
ncbi:MAG: hypothetical protein IPK29_08600 [Betaproteobacteria bacterium]|nr:hypothetical protein [Betaproteobacteria bacterium]